MARNILLPSPQGIIFKKPRHYILLYKVVASHIRSLVVTFHKLWQHEQKINTNFLLELNLSCILE